MPALLDLYASEPAANAEALKAHGIELGVGLARRPAKTRDVLAERRGREAAENISLALQLGGARPRDNAELKADIGASQMDLAF